MSARPIFCAVESDYGHTFMGTDSEDVESCLTCGAREAVTFTARGFQLDGTVVRHKKNGVVTVNAPVVYRMSDGTPMLDTRNEMWWDIPSSALSRRDPKVGA